LLRNDPEERSFRLFCRGSLKSRSFRLRSICRQKVEFLDGEPGGSSTNFTQILADLRRTFCVLPYAERTEGRTEPRPTGYTRSLLVFRAQEVESRWDVVKLRHCVSSSYPEVITRNFLLCR